MSVDAPPMPSYDVWSATCDTLHAHTQVLGKLAVRLAPPEPELQACGGELLAAIGSVAGEVEIDRTPQEVTWSVPLDEDHEHARYDPDQVTSYFAAASRAALVLAAFRAPYRGRSTPVNAWWGSFDLAVSLFSGRPADPPSQDFIMRNAMDAQEVAVGWWPGGFALREGGVLCLRPPRARGLRRRSSRRRRPAGTKNSASTSSTGRTLARAQTRSLPSSIPPARRSSTPAWCVRGIRRSPPAPKGIPRRSSSPPRVHATAMSRCLL